MSSGICGCLSNLLSCIHVCTVFLPVSVLYFQLYPYCNCICIQHYLTGCLSHACRQEFVAVYLSYNLPRFKYAPDTVDTCMGKSWQGSKRGIRLIIYTIHLHVPTWVYHSRVTKRNYMGKSIENGGRSL